jgi:hypothetical protein
MKRTNKQRREKLESDLEAQNELAAFKAALQKNRPAVETFTPAALMLIYLAMGTESLLKQENETTNP